jgi:hypothetical protein
LKEKLWLFFDFVGKFGWIFSDLVEVKFSIFIFGIFHIFSQISDVKWDLLEMS